MLLSFRAVNFKSIREAAVLNLTAVSTRKPEKGETLLETPIKSIKALRAAAIYGSNASGKSNILDSMRMFESFVSNSHRKWDPSAEISRDTFLLDQDSKRDDTLFEITFSRDANVFRYGFSYDSTHFTSEWLYDVTGPRDKTMFLRTGSGNEVKVKFPGKNLATSPKALDVLNSIAVQTRPNSLFLSAAAQQNNSDLLAIQSWITSRFDPLHSLDSMKINPAEKELWSDPARKTLFKELLCFADFGVGDFEITEEETPEEQKKFSAALFKTLQDVMPQAFSSDTNFGKLPDRQFSLKLLHQGKNGELYPLEGTSESSGTKTYTQMLAQIIRVLGRGGLLLADEIETSLHPLLAKQIVRMFNEPELNPLGAQLIFTTHSVSLLDLDLLRRDQVWFTEKDDEGASSLTSLVDYKPRKDQDIAAAYLNGRFGAIPLISEYRLHSAFSSSSGNAASETDEAVQ